jgi:hypothetical protein
MLSQSSGTIVPRDRIGRLAKGDMTPPEAADESNTNRQSSQRSNVSHNGMAVVYDLQFLRMIGIVHRNRLDVQGLVHPLV